MELVKNYMLDRDLRHGLNDLTKATFGFTFENWVTNGYFQGEYFPNSFLHNGRIISNISVNIMDFKENDEILHYLQIGTVMTSKEYRNQGLAKKLMQSVLEEYSDKCQGIYLFGNLSALGFYDKLGFKRVMEYRYTLKETPKMLDKAHCFVPAGKEMLEKYKDTVKNAAINSAFQQINRYGLQMFYTAGMDDVYYSSDLDCFAVMEKENDTLFLQSVVSKHRVPMKEVISRINEYYSALILGFTPVENDKSLFSCTLYDGADDYRLCCLGEDLRRIQDHRLLFPAMSHA